MITQACKQRLNFIVESGKEDDSGTFSCFCSEPTLVVGRNYILKRVCIVWSILDDRYIYGRVFSDINTKPGQRRTYKKRFFRIWYFPRIY